MSEFMDIITASNLTYGQKLIHLAQAAENCEHPIPTTPEFDWFFERDAICDMHEGNAPYRPRYICCDMERFARQGSDFLRLDAPDNLDDLLMNLQILYQNVPSVTGRPVYVGQLDRVFDPFLDGLSDEEILPRFKRFLNYIDRTVASGYCHANLGPEDTRAGRLLLQADAEVQKAVPNFTLKYEEGITPDDFARLALKTSMACANPAYANHRMHKHTYAAPVDGPADGYTVVSCYNVLPVRGGAYCLDRVKLSQLADLATSPEHLLNELLPSATGALLEYMDARIKFLVEDSNFFQTSFLVREGLIDRERFVGMFGMIGMHECIEKLLGPGHVYGTDPEANDLADQIMTKMTEQVQAWSAPYSEIADGHYLMHAQAGFGDQTSSTPGVRIRVGSEPEVFFDHIRHCARMHRFFKAGVSDIFPVEPTAANNVDALLDVVKGAFAIDDTYLSFYPSDSDLVRITGFLVKRSEMEKFARGEAVLADTSHDGEGNWRANNLADRKVRLG